MIQNAGDMMVMDKEPLSISPISTGLYLTVAYPGPSWLLVNSCFGGFAAMQFLRKLR